MSQAAAEKSLPRLELGRVVLLVAVWAAALYSLAAALYSGQPGGPPPGIAVRPQEPRGVSRYFVRWDSAFYLAIAESGYAWKDEERLHNLRNPAFFPLYPFLIRCVARSAGIDPAAAGEIISLAALFAAMVLLARLTRREGFEPLTTVGVMLLFPTALYFLCVYSESVFLLMAVACLLSSREDRPALAFVFGALAALTRVHGVLLSIPLFYFWWADRRTVRTFFASLGPVAGLAGVCVFDAVNLGRPLAWLTVQRAAWHHSLLWPWQVIARGFSGSMQMYFGTTATLIFGGLAVFLWRRQRACALWVAANLALTLLSGSMISSGRYLIPLFPAFWAIGSVAGRSRLSLAVYLLASAGGLIYNLFRFTHGIWVG